MRKQAASQGSATSLHPRHKLFSKDARCWHVIDMVAGEIEVTPKMHAVILRMTSSLIAAPWLGQSGSSACEVDPEYAKLFLAKARLET